MKESKRKDKGSGYRGKARLKERVRQERYKIQNQIKIKMTKARTPLKKKGTERERVENMTEREDRKCERTEKERRGWRRKIEHVLKRRHEETCGSQYIFGV